jgi:hypothetical protein
VTGSGRKMPSVVRDEEVAEPGEKENEQDGQGGERQNGRFLARATVTRNPSQSPKALSTELLGNSKNLTRSVRTMTNTRDEQELKIEASIATIEENIGQERPELRLILSELKRGLEGQLNKQHSDMEILVIMLGKDKLHSSYPSSIIGWIQRFEKLVDKVDKAMCKNIEENRCESVTMPNPSPRSEERKSSGSNNQDHTKNCRTNNEENNIEKTDDNREALSRIRHTSIANALTSGRTNYHQKEKKTPIVAQDQKKDEQWLLETATASTGSTTLDNGTKSASETTEDCKRQKMRTVASQKNRGVTPTQPNESLDINPESEKQQA